MSDSTDEMLLPPKAKRGRINVSENEENTDSTVEMLIPAKAKSGRNSDDECENEENKDRLSDLPDGVLLHILSFLTAKYAVRTCILSTRWKDLWKRLPNLILHTKDFSTRQFFTKFVSTILKVRDGSTALHTLDFERIGSIQPPLIKRIVNYAVSHKVQQLGIHVECDMGHLLPCIFTCHTLTSLMLLVSRSSVSTLFPESLNLPALTTLHLKNFTFCSNSNNARADPFSTFNRLNSLIIDHCDLKGARILCISSTMLANLTLRPTEDIYTIELSTPCLYRLTCKDFPSQYLTGSGVSSVKEVNFDMEICFYSLRCPVVLLSWLRDLINIRSLTVSTNTLQVLLLVPDLLKIKLPSLAYLKRLKIKRERVPEDLKHMMRQARLKKAATETRKEAAKLRKEAATIWKTRRDGKAPFPDEIVNFLIQNSPSAEVQIIDCFN